MSGIETVAGIVLIASTVSNVINIAKKSHSFAKWVHKKNKRSSEKEKEKYTTWQWVEDLEEEYVIIEK
tara:strand:- start:1111 stop:1314 length:204 start_codon:yes stop_codon:yes gene_type:complete